MAAKAIRRGHVLVDDAVCRDPAIQVSDGARVVADGEPVVRVGRLVLALHKPLGVVSATVDPSERTVLDLLPESCVRAELRLAGRLDKDTTGLLILTNDGELIHKLTHPRHHVEKEYLVDYDGVLEAPVARIAEGLELEDGTRCDPARFEPLGAQRARLVLREGKYHQVRRMVAACGGRVTALHRARVGSYRLPEHLPAGAAVPLTAEEEATLLS